jgi:hypothetical protein
MWQAEGPSGLGHCLETLLGFCLWSWSSSPSSAPIMYAIPVTSYRRCVSLAVALVPHSAYLVFRLLMQGAHLSTSCNCRTKDLACVSPAFAPTSVQPSEVLLDVNWRLRYEPPTRSSLMILVSLRACMPSLYANLPCTSPPLSRSRLFDKPLVPPPFSTVSCGSWGFLPCVNFM